MRGGLLPALDPLGEFGPERIAPIGPAIARRAPQPPDTRRATLVAVAGRAPATTSEFQRAIWSFALGSVFGVLLCLIGVYWLTASELPRLEPVARAVPEMPPAREPAIAVADKPRDPVVVGKTSLTEASTPKRRDVRRVAIPSPAVQVTNSPFVGSLQIDSTPRGARVFIDRTEVGVTPLIMANLVAGSHVVRLETEGHTPWSSAIRVIADRQTDVRTILARSDEEVPRR